MTSEILKRLQESPPPSDALLGTIRSCVGIIGLTIVLWANAADFDVTEGQSIALMLLVFSGSEGIAAGLKGLMKGVGGKDG